MNINFLNIRRKIMPFVTTFTVGLVLTTNFVFADENVYNNTDNNTSVVEYEDFSINDEYDYSSNEEFEVKKTNEINVNNVLSDEIKIEDNDEIAVNNTDTINIISEDDKEYNSIKSLNSYPDSLYSINPGDNLRKVILQRAFSQLGTSYVWGSINPWNSFDCSGLSTYAYRGIGYNLPRTSYNQANVGLTVPLNKAKAGDLLFFGKGPVSHVGIYTGNYTMVHASPNNGICYVDLNNYNMSNFKWAKNVIDF